MENQKTDPFGNIKGDEKKAEENNIEVDPFTIDLNDAKEALQKSIDAWDGKVDVRSKTSLLDRVREREKIRKWKPPFFEYVNEFDREYVDIHLYWSAKIIRSIKNVPKKNARVALVGLRSFFKQINNLKPDLSHPDILKCYNVTAEAYKTEPHPYSTDLAFDPELHLDPFAGVKGDERMNKSNQFRNDLQKALEEINFSIDFLSQLDVPHYRREYRFKKRKSKCAVPTNLKSNAYFDIFLWWPGGAVHSVENVPTNRAIIALATARKFLEDIDTQFPDLQDEMVNIIYNQTKQRTKPGQKSKDRMELKPTEEGGLSYWSRITHRWVKGHFSKAKNTFVSPEKGI